jgi:DNA-binding NarL/FixJ family response regulator
LQEIKANKHLKQVPVIVYSTSQDTPVIDLLFENGAHYFIRKIADFVLFKAAIQEAIALVLKEGSFLPLREHFVLTNVNKLTINEL